MGTENNTQEEAQWPEFHPYISLDNYQKIRDSAFELGLNADLWNHVVSFAEKYMGGRPGFEHHTWTIVDWAIKLSREAIQIDGEVNLKVVFLSAFLHDIGYEIADKAIETNVKRSKGAHAERGRDLAKPFLEDLIEKGLVSTEEMKEVLDIVLVHDEIKELSDPERNITMNTKLLVAADTLGVISFSYGQPSFGRDGLERWWMKGKLDRFALLPDFAKKYYVELSKKMFDYIDDKSVDGIVEEVK